MACDKAAVALLTFAPPDAKAWLYDLIDANPATGIMLCRKHANATVVPMSWQLIDSRDPSWTPPGEPAAPQPQPAAIPGLLTDETVLTEPLVAATASHVAVSDYPGAPEDPGMPRLPRLPAPPVVEPAAAAPAMATILSTTVHRPAQPTTFAEPTAPVYESATHHTVEPAAFTPTVTAPSTTAAMPASPMVGTAAVAVVAPPLPAPHIDPPVTQPTAQHSAAENIARRTETIRVEAVPGERVSHVVGLNEQIAAHARPVEQQQWVEPVSVPGPPAAADLVANLQERLLPDPSLFELPLDTPAVTPHQGYR